MSEYGYCGTDEGHINKFKLGWNIILYNLSRKNVLYNLAAADFSSNSAIKVFFHEVEYFVDEWN